MIVGRERAGRLSQRAPQFFLADMRRDFSGNVGNKLILKIKEVVARRIPPLTPDRATAFGFAQLDRDANLVAHASNVAADEVADAKKFADRYGVVFIKSEAKGRPARDHEQLS